MYFFITLEKIKSVLATVGIVVSETSAFESAVLFLLGNIVYILGMLSILAIAWKIITRILRFVF